MDSKLLTQRWSFSIILPSQSAHDKRLLTPVHAVHIRPRDLPSLNLVQINPVVQTDTATSDVYKDSWIDLLAINYLSKVLEETAGAQSRKKGYDGLVEIATMASRVLNPEKQHKVVVQALEKAIPSFILSMIKELLPQSQFKREYFAAFTTVFFTWLIGPSEVKESEFNGRKEKNVVYIKKCRFLEQTNCIGMCTNLCKMPSQTFIKETMGMPVNMVPNFDDMSCEMIFGQEPPDAMDDPVFKQPCYKSCKESRKHGIKCA